MRKGLFCSWLRAMAAGVVSRMLSGLLWRCESVDGLSDCRPVDADAFALHAAEPCHLPFGELMDGGG